LLSCPSPPSSRFGSADKHERRTLRMTAIPPRWSRSCLVNLCSCEQQARRSQAQRRGRQARRKEGRGEASTHKTLSHRSRLTPGADPRIELTLSLSGFGSAHTDCQLAGAVSATNAGSGRRRRRRKGASRRRRLIGFICAPLSRSPHAGTAGPQVDPLLLLLLLSRNASLFRGGHAR
jgi:hypothetical protein